MAAWIQRAREQILAGLKLTQWAATFTLGYLASVAEALERRGRQGRRPSASRSGAPGV